MKTILASLALVALASLASVAPANAAEPAPRAAVAASPAYALCHGTEWGIPVTYRCNPVTGERLSNRFVFRR